jgi:DNA polymerase-3 subunit beta
MQFEKDRVEFSVMTPDLGEAHDEMDLGYAGEPIQIGFNANYLLEVLRYVGTDEVKLGFKAPERAATIEPVLDDGAEKRDYLCLVMPLRLVD